MKNNPLLPQQRLDHYERKARQQGYVRIAGIDEAGRGPLAGPVVAAACILPDGFDLPGIDDSKKLTPEKREEFYAILCENPAILSGIGIVEAIIIDQINILQATLQAMTAAIMQLKEKPDYILVDGNRLPPVKIAGESIIKGDNLSGSIMAAAILAKVTRDRIMKKLDKEWPGYGFALHKGYPTAKHLEALRLLGPCPEHRQSYEPVRLAYAT
jgi:ribonuclease HII